MLIDTLTFLFTDIEGSTALLRRLGDQAYSQALDEHHRIIRHALKANGGREQGTQGDSFFATFTSPSGCVDAAIEMQTALSQYPWPRGEQLRVRMGIHTGVVTEISTGLVGYEVHRAARIAAVGHGGQVLLSTASAGLLEDTLPTEVSLRSLGVHRLKDLGRPETIYQLVADGLESDFEPLRSLDNPDFTNNLPASLNPLVGRLSELEEVRRLVVESRLVTLTGAGGAGKTRLALQVGAELLDGSGEGVWLVELASVTDPERVPSSVISAMRLHQEADTQALDGLIKILRTQNVLIILDNCEHVIDVVAKVVEDIGRHCPNVSIIATSREPLGVDGERVYRVRSLSLPTHEVEGTRDVEGSDAVDLFVNRARARDSTFELSDEMAPLVASICRRLDGIPLAIELAASRLSSMSLDDLHDRLDQRFRLLTGGSRNALPRQQTLGATVAWSYDLLSDSERDLLRRLSVFVGGFDLRGAEVVCADARIESYEIADLLSSLVNKSLVVADRMSTSLRYHLLETIRQYAADQLVQDDGASEVERLRRLHAEYYSQLCLDAQSKLVGSDQGAWLKRLDLEYDNLLAMFTTLGSDPGRTADVLALGVALLRFFVTRRNADVPNFLRAAVASTTPVAVELRVEALLALSAMTRTIGSQEHSKQNAYDLSDEAFNLAGQLNDEPLIIRALIRRAEALSDLDRRDTGLELAKVALERARTLGDRRLIAEATASLIYNIELPSESKEECLEALEIFRELDDRFWIASMVSFLSTALDTTPQGYQEARALNDEAMVIAEEIGSTFHLMFLWHLASVFSYLLGEYDVAVHQIRRGLRLARRNGSPATLIFWNIFYLSCCVVEQGDFVLGAQLTGAYRGFEERAIEPLGGWWTPVDLEIRESSWGKIHTALEGEELEQALNFGRGLSADRLFNVAMGRTDHEE